MLELYLLGCFINLIWIIIVAIQSIGHKCIKGFTLKDEIIFSIIIILSSWLWVWVMFMDLLHRIFDDGD